MVFKKILPIFLSFFFLAASIVYVADRDKIGMEQKAEKRIQPVAKPTEEMRGVWVTYMTLDVSAERDKRTAFQNKIDRIIEDMVSADLNTMVVQVRPFCDAIYPSRYFPWSHILTGNQGEDPGFDPLEYIVAAAHQSGIMVHAWINPYRITANNTPSSLSSNHPYSKNSDIGVEVGSNLYLDPASQETIQLIADGAKEIAENYNVDGIQFDDYFYPPDCGDFDADTYQSYCDTTAQPLSLADFRKDNVNRMVAAVYEAVHQAKPGIPFGISPQGNWQNNEKLYADVGEWCAKEGYIDYICPQIYFSLDNPALTFEDGLQDWLDAEKHESLSLYFGLPAYKAGTDADDGTWLDNDDILKTEVTIAEEQSDGFILYSYDSFHNEENAEEIQNVIRYLTEEQ